MPCGESVSKHAIKYSRWVCAVLLQYEDMERVFPYRCPVRTPLRSSLARCRSRAPAILRVSSFERMRSAAAWSSQRHVKRLRTGGQGSVQTWQSSAAVGAAGSSSGRPRGTVRISPFERMSKTFQSFLISPAASRRWTMAFA